MVFSSVPFLYVFLPVVLLCCFVVPKRFKNLVLLAASLFFYYYGERAYTSLLLISSLSDYLHSLYIEKHRGTQRAKAALISSIAVWPDSRGKYEDDTPLPDGLPAYGKNRLQLENWVREDFPEALIVRLPALYGAGLKKNFLFDLHTITPAMLRPEKYAELAAKSDLVKTAYTLADNGFYKLNGTADRAALKQFFAHNDFNALAFTDSRSCYQFYDLGRLWSDIGKARAAGIKMLHLCTPPVSAAEVYTAVTGQTDWHNELAKPPFDYDLRSRYAQLLGGSGAYLCTKQEELDDITRFLRDWRN